MRKLLFLLSLTAISAQAEQASTYDYAADNRTMIRNGVQAVMMCNGLFTSKRTLSQVFSQELAYLPDRVGTPAGGEYLVDHERQAVAVGGTTSGPVIRAAFRQGIGCVVMPPDQSFADIDALPVLVNPPAADDAANLAWPMGDVITDQTVPAEVDLEALQAASNWAFERPTAEQVTLSLIVLYQGQIVHERYADGVDMFTRTRTWSTAKSIAATLIGMLVDGGQLALDAPLDIEWLPALPAAEHDPRNRITLRHVLHMSSGLDPVDSFGQEYATGSGLSYWAGASSVDGARRRGLVRKPGTSWDYENYDTLLAVYAMKQALADKETYANFPRTALLDKIGMRNTLVSTDRFGDFILSSQVYASARDLARFGLLYANDGVWQDERLISQDWISFVRTPAPATAGRGNMYGGQFWLVPDDRKDVPPTAYTTRGNRGQYVVIVPSHDVVIVRRGLDYGRQGFDPLDLTREVLKAIRN